MMQFTSHRIGRRSLHVIDSGNGDPAIVFLHGMGMSHATWRACMERLAHAHRVVAPDYVGHGESPVPDDPAEYTRDRTLDDIDDILDWIAAPTVLVGHSLGGYLALAYAATRPGRAAGIVVLNTGPGYRDPDKRDAWNARSRRNAHRFGVPEHVADLNLQADSVVMDRLADLDVPVLALAGSLDRPEYTTSGEYLARKMRRARFESVEGGEHSMHESTHADVVARLVAEFVDGLTRST